MNVSHEVKTAPYVWMEEEMEYFLQAIKEKSIITHFWQKAVTNKQKQIIFIDFVRMHALDTFRWKHLQIAIVVYQHFRNIAFILRKKNCNGIAASLVFLMGRGPKVGHRAVWVAVSIHPFIHPSLIPASSWAQGHGSRKEPLPTGQRQTPHRQIPGPESNWQSFWRPGRFWQFPQFVFLFDGSPLIYFDPCVLFVCFF